MPIVDSHCHASISWYEPIEVLVDQMDRNGVDHAVLVQIMGQTDNSYLLDCLRRVPGRFAVVVLVDPGRADAGEQLARLAARGASGVRLPAAARSPGPDPLAVWRAAERLGLAVSCAGTSGELSSAEFANLVQAVPDLPIVLEHLGSVSAPDADPAQAASRRRAFGLARFPGVFIKVPGLGEFCRRSMPITEPFPFVLPVPPLLDLAFGAFGPGRMMWGSDYPPMSGREG